MRYLWIIALASVVFVWGLSGCVAEESVEDGRIEAKLRELKPLPKVHYSNWLSNSLTEDSNSRILYELARITHGLTLSGEWCTSEQVDNCLYTCARINKTNPATKCSLALQFSPWHQKFGKDLPATDKGPTYEAELLFFTNRLNLVKNWVAISNKKYDVDVKINALLLDSERFHVVEGNALLNDAIREKLDRIHEIAKEAFPEAGIYWYGRGVQQIWGKDGWGQTSYFTGKEIKAPLSCSFYSLPEPQRMQETYRRTCMLADEVGIKEVIPWVALASGFRRGLVNKQYWDFNWQYDLIYSFETGAELNIPWFSDRPKRFAEYDRAKIIVFYPAPFDKRTPGWAKHFIAYVRGATGVNDLNDLGWKEPIGKSSTLP